MKNNLIVVLGVALILSVIIGYFAPEIKYYKLMDSTRVELSEGQYIDAVIEEDAHNEGNNYDKWNNLSEERNINFSLMVMSFVMIMGGGLICSVILPDLRKKRTLSLILAKDELSQLSAIRTPKKLPVDNNKSIGKIFDVLGWPLNPLIEVSAPIKKEKTITDIDSTQLEKYNRVGGWLLLLCFALIIGGPLRALYGISALYNEMLEYQDKFPNLQITFYVGISISFILIISGIISGSELLRRKKGAVKTTKTYLIVFFGFSILLSILPYFAGLPSEADAFLFRVFAKRMVEALLFSGIWYWYLSVSKRIKITYAIYPLSCGLQPLPAESEKGVKIV